MAEQILGTPVTNIGADKTFDPILQQPEPWKVPEFEDARVKAEIKQQEDVENANLWDKWAGFSATHHTTFLSNTSRWVEYDLAERGQVDKVWQGEISKGTALFDTYAQAGVQRQYWDRMSEPRNQNHMNSLIDWALKDQADEALISNTLNGYGGMLSERGVSTLMTNVAGDIDSFTLPIGGLALKLGAAKRAVQAGVATTQVGVSSVAYKVDPNISGGEAAFLATVGASVDSLALGNVANRMQKMAADVPADETINGLAKDIIDTETAKARSSLEETLALRKERSAPLTKDEEALSRALEVQDEVTATGKPTKRALAAQQQLADLGYTKPTAPSQLDTEVQTLADIQTRLAERKKMLQSDRASEAFADMQDEIDTLRANDKKLTSDQQAMSDALEHIDEVDSRGNMTKRAEEARAKIDEIVNRDKMAAETKLKRAEDARQQRLAEHRAEQLTTLQEKIKANKVKTGFTAFERRIKELQSYHTTKKNSAALRELSHQMKEFKGSSHLVKASVDEFKKLVGELTKKLELDPTNPTLLKDRKAVDDTMGSLVDSGFMTKVDYRKYDKAMKTGDISHLDDIKLKFKDNGDGTVSMIKRNGKKGKGNLKIPIALAVAIGVPTIASADDGSAIVAVGGIAALVLAVAAGKVSLMHYPAIVSGVKKTGANMKALAQTRSTRAKLDKTIDSARISFFESFTPLMKDGKKEFTDLVQKLLYDAFDGTTFTVERGKTRMVHQWDHSLQKSQGMAYKEWKKTQGFSRMSLFRDGIGMRQRFEEMTMEYVEHGWHADDVNIAKAGEEIRALKAGMFKQMKEAGVEGIDKIVNNPNHMPRVLRSGPLGTTLRSLDTANYEKVINAFATMMKGDKKKAKLYVDLIREYGTSKNTMLSIEDLQKYIKDNNIQGLSANQAAEMLGIHSRVSQDGAHIGGQFGATKYRIEMDKTKFQPVDIVTESGEQINLNLRDIFVSNSIEVMSGFINKAAGYTAFADAGITPQAAYSTARKAINPRNQKIIEETIDLLLGQPILDEASGTTKLLRDLTNYTVLMKMPFSVLSLSQEAAVVFSSANAQGWHTAAKEVKNIFMKYGKSSAMLDELTNNTGWATHNYTGSYGVYNHLDEGSNLVDGSYRSTAAGKVFSQTGEMGRDIVLYNLGMIPISDWLTKVAMVTNATDLYKIANGTKKIPDYMTKAYGITPSDLQIFKKRLRVGSNGELEKLNLDTWDRSERLAFFKVIDNMNMKMVQQTTYGSTGAWTRNSTVGIATSALLKFPMMAYSNHGLFGAKGMVEGDPRQFGRQFMWFAGAYVNVLLRDALAGRESKPEDVMLKALWAMPILGGFNVVEGVTDGALFETADSVNVIGDAIYAK